MKPLIRYGALACAVMLGACSDGSTDANQATPLLNADVARMAADAAGEDVDMMREPVEFVGLAPSFAPGNGDLNPANCPYNPATQRLECPVVVRGGGLSITRSYAFFNAANAAQQAYDALLTARANIRSGVEGTRSNDNWSATVARHREFNVTGLVGTETQRTWTRPGLHESHFSSPR